MFNPDDERLPSHRRRLVFTSADTLYSPFGTKPKPEEIPVKIKCKSCPVLIRTTRESGGCRRCEEKLRREKLLSIVRNNNLINEREALTVGNPTYLVKHNSSFKPHHK